MSFLDLYQGDQAQAATIQPNEGHDLPSTFSENFDAAWSDGQLFSQSVARENARAAVLGDYASEVKQKTGYDINSEDVPSGPEAGVSGTFDRINSRVADLKAKFPDLDLNPLSEDEIDQRALAKAQAAHRNYAALQAGERTAGGGFGSFLGSAASSSADPVNLVALAVAPETGGASILGAALRWGALAGVSQAAIEANSNTFKEQVQPGYTESGQPLKEIAGATFGGAVLGGGFKALGNAWTRVKTGAWPTSVRDAGNVIESEAHVAETNPFVAPKSPSQRLIEAAVPSNPDNAIVFVDAAKVDAMLGPMNRTYTPEKRAGAKEFLASQPETWNPPELNARVNKRHGGDIVDIVDGQHRWAAMRDQNMAVVPVEMDAASVAKAKTLGILTDRPTEQPVDFGGVAGEVAHREALVKTIDDILANRPVDVSAQVTPELQQSADEAARAQVVPEEPSGLPPEQLTLPLEPETEPMAPKIVTEPGPQPVLQTPEQMAETLTAPDHQDAIRADIDRERAMGDVQVPGIDEMGNHTMVSVDAAMDEVDAYKAAAEHIQACANPPAEEEAA